MSGKRNVSNVEVNHTFINLAKLLRALPDDDYTKLEQVLLSRAAPDARRLTIMARVSELIGMDKTNAEIWPIIRREYDLPDDKRWYPAWYRAELRRRGRRMAD